MIALLRFLFLIPIAFVLACIAAAFAMLWPFIDTSGAARGDVLFWIEATFGFLAQTAQIGRVALVPWAVFMVATEAFGWRSLVLHMAAGLAAGYGVMRAAYGATLPHASVQTVMMVAGLTFALVYWLLAGRSAGRWRMRAATVSSPASQTVETAPRS